MRHLLGIYNEEALVTIWDCKNKLGTRRVRFSYIIDKVKSITQSWKQRHLSNGGKEVLLKPIALSMPIYSMTIFRLPKDVYAEINAILAKFWWGLEIRKVYTGIHVPKYVCQKEKGALVLRIWKSLIRHYLVNKYGELCNTHTV